MTQPLVSDLIAQPVLVQAHGTLAAPVADVATLLLAVHPGRVGYDNALVLADRPEARTGGLSIMPHSAPGSFRAVGAGEVVDLCVDHAIPALAVRTRLDNVYTVKAGNGVSHLVHRIHGAPPDAETYDGLESRMRTALAQVIRVIADTLDVDGAVSRHRQGSHGRQVRGARK